MKPIIKSRKDFIPLDIETSIGILIPYMEYVNVEYHYGKVQICINMNCLMWDRRFNYISEQMNELRGALEIIEKEFRLYLRNSIVGSSLMLDPNMVFRHFLSKYTKYVSGVSEWCNYTNYTSSAFQAQLYPIMFDA